jgi:ATP-dependent DNA helicase RecQ
MPLPESTLQKLHRVFEFDRLRDGQEDVVARLLAGKSVLAIFPTGGGKSLCYQLPALEFPELTVVVSPLIALMKDQIDFLTRKGVAAARLDSSLEEREYRRVMDDLTRGRLKLLYVSPERLSNERFQQTLRRLKLALLAVDEAHCISEWGHNFRPDYLKLALLARELKIPRVLALTATAPPAVASDIARSFEIAECDVICTGFYRKNLNLYLTPCTPEEKVRLLAERLRQHPRGATIVYVTLQRTAEEVAGELVRAGLPAKAYHAGMESEVRTLIQDWFMASPDAIVVATIAFGMGIDKSNIRAVYHFNLPKTLENYAQEIGRAGRDGETSRCELLASPADRITLENFIFGDTPTSESVAAFVDHLLNCGDTFDISAYELSGRFDIRPLVLETILTYMELDGVLTATGQFFDEYKFQPLKSSAEILAKFDPRRAEFLRKLFKSADRLQTWFRLDVQKAMNAAKEPRQKIISALNYLEEQGDFKLQLSGSRLGFRQLKKPVRDHLLKTMAERFEQRERRDQERLQQVLEYASHAGCRTRFLTRYFGEDLPGDCGHCGWCAGEREAMPSPTPGRDLGEEEAKLVRSLRSRNLPALATPRQITRYLCGLPSPAAQRTKLTKEPGYGVLSEVPFQQVLKWTERVR